VENSSNTDSPDSEVYCPFSRMGNCRAGCPDNQHRDCINGE